MPPQPSLRAWREIAAIPLFRSPQLHYSASTCRSAFTGGLRLTSSKYSLFARTPAAKVAKIPTFSCRTFATVGHLQNAISTRAFWDPLEELESGLGRVLLQHGAASADAKRKLLTKHPLTLVVDSGRFEVAIEVPSEVYNKPENVLVTKAAARVNDAFVDEAERIEATVPMLMSEKEALETAQFLADNIQLPLLLNYDGSVESSDGRVRLINPVLTTDKFRGDGSADEIDEDTDGIAPSVMASTHPEVAPPVFPFHRSLFGPVKFGLNFFLNSRFYFIFIARTIFQSVRPLLAFCLFGEVMKAGVALLATAGGSGVLFYLFSFVLAFEVLYFFLQCFISYVFLGMFFAAAF